MFGYGARIRYMCLSAAVAALLSASGSAVLAAEDGPKWKVPLLSTCPTKTSVTIDGVKAGDEWAHAAVLSDFMDNGLPAPRYVKAYVTYDSKALYICVQSKSPTLKKDFTDEKRDELICGDDAVEIWLQPPGAGTNHYQFMVNANNAIYDAHVTDTKWNPEWTSKSTVDGDMWTLEMAIPFASLDVAAPADGEVWGFNIWRDLKNPFAWTAYAPLHGFARLRFTENGPVLQMDSTGKLSAGEMRIIGGVYASVGQSATLAWEVKNLKSEQVLLSSNMPIELQSGVRYDFDKVIVPPVPISPTVEHTLKISLSSASGEGLFDQVIKFVPAEPLSIRLKPDAKRGILTVTLDIRGISSALRAGVTGEASVLKDGKVVLEPVKLSDFKDAIGLATFQTKSMADGDYTVRASVADASGAVITSKDTTLRLVANPEWLNSSLGIDDDVPAPWTPLTVGKSGINCWNRNYRFGDSAFPAQITVGEQNAFSSVALNLLSGPIELRGSSNGKSFKWSNSVSKVTQKGKSRVTLSTSAQSAGVNLSVVNTCEFDGFMRLDVTLSPVSGTKKIDKLFLRIPIDSRYAKNKYGYGIVSGGGKGSHQPTEPGMIGELRAPWRSEFLPGLWIGDIGHGIGWYCEGQKNWSQKLPDNALTITSEGKSTVLQVNFVDTPTVLDKPITLTFALQATPVKPFPRPKDWLTFRPVECPGNKLFFCGWGGSTRWGGFPVVGNSGVPLTDPMAFDDTSFKAEVAAKHAQGLFLPMYLNAGTMVLEIPEVQTYLEDWECTPEQVMTTDMNQPDVLACPQAKDWQDLFLYRMKQFYDKYDLDAIYMDFGFCQRCDNARHGCGYDTPDGRQGTWPIFAHRELHKRIYKILKKARPNSPLVTLGHPGGSLNLPHINFWDASVEGEYINVDIRGTVYKGDYTAYYSAERFKTEFSGRTFNSVPISMFYTQNGDAKCSKTIFAMALVHGSLVWPAWIDLMGAVYQVYYALDRFGVADVQEFLPYWDNRGALEVDHQGAAYATAYKKAGKSLIVVSNLSPDDLDVHLHINAKVLGLKDNLVVTDAMSGESLQVQASCLTLPVGNKDFRLLVVSN